MRAWFALEPALFGDGKIYPHEQTMSGPKADRLSLYEATGFNLSPVFGLYPDPNADVQRTVEAGLRDRTPLVTTDHLGVESRLWVVTDQETHTALGGLMAENPCSSPTATTAGYTRFSAPAGIANSERKLVRQKATTTLPTSA